MTNKIFLAGIRVLNEFACWQKGSLGLCLDGSEERLFFSHESYLLTINPFKGATLLFGNEINLIWKIGRWALLYWCKFIVYIFKRWINKVNYYITGSKQYCSLYRGLRYIQLRYIKVPLYQAWKFPIAVLSIAFLACWYFFVQRVLFMYTLSLIMTCLDPVGGRPIIWSKYWI